MENKMKLNLYISKLIRGIICKVGRQKARELIKDLDRGVSKAFPQMQAALDRSLTAQEKELFYKQLNDLLFDGDLTKLSDPAKTNAFIKDLTKKGVDEKVVKNIIDTIDESRVKIGGLIESTGNLNSKELKNILQDRKYLKTLQY